MSTTTRYALIGHPVAHSYSPFIHRQFAVETQQNMSYELLPAEPGHFIATVEQFRKQGGQGLNVTLPFKIEAYDYADEKSERAQWTGAVNTLKFTEDGKVFADNADGIGLIRDLTQNLNWKLDNKCILVLGAGGAARGILAPLLQLNPKQLVISNRTFIKATELAQQFKTQGVVQAIELSSLTRCSFDLIINATAASLYQEIPAIPSTLISRHTYCYDLVYSAKPTIFLEWAKQQGCSHYADGLGMLVEQAAESFNLWRGVYPDTATVLNALRNKLH